jgi:RNA-splicing ligase RtcB
MYISEETFRKKADLFDAHVRCTIPAGLNVRQSPYAAKEIADVCHMYFSHRFKEWWNSLDEVCKITEQDYGYVRDSLGTLGGGNHFIEIDKEENGNLWLVVHSGSRNFGLKIANFHQKKAYDTLTKRDVSGMIEEIKRTRKGKEIEEAIKALKKDAVLSVPRHLAHLEGDAANLYLEHMGVAQAFAGVNRRLMMAEMLSFFNVEFDEAYIYESVHNYIDLTHHQVIRKGAISARALEPVLIPLTMKAGIILGKGKGNEEWNYSAPHGAGRKMSRRKAKEELKLEDYQKEMTDSGVWTSSVSEDTLDEAPGAYKDPKEIIDALKDTVHIEQILKPVYNFKAGKE